MRALTPGTADAPESGSLLPKAAQHCTPHGASPHNRPLSAPLQGLSSEPAPPTAHPGSSLSRLAGLAPCFPITSGRHQGASPSPPPRSLPLPTPAAFLAFQVQPFSTEPKWTAPTSQQADHAPPSGTQTVLTPTGPGADDCGQPDLVPTEGSTLKGRGYL